MVSLGSGLPEFGLVWHELILFYVGGFDFVLQRVFWCRFFLLDFEGSVWHRFVWLHFLVLDSICLDLVGLSFIPIYCVLLVSIFLNFLSVRTIRCLVFLDLDFLKAICGLVEKYEVSICFSKIPLYGHRMVLGFLFGRFIPEC